MSKPPLVLGSPPYIDAVLSGRLAELNARTIRHFITTFRHPPNADGSAHLWGSPDVTAMRVMFYAALERACQIGILDALSQKQRAGLPVETPMPASIPRITDIDPGYLDDSEVTTAKYRRHQDPERPRTMVPPPIPSKKPSEPDRK